MKRIVIDTNVLIGSAYNERSAGRRIIEACLAGELTLVLSPKIRREYEHIIAKAVRRNIEADRLAELIDRAEWVEPDQEPRVVADDPDDDKFLAAARAGRAEAIISNDRHLLELDPWQGIRILRPADFDQGSGRS